MRPEEKRRRARGLPPVVRASARTGWRARLAWWMRCAADRIDGEGAFRCMSPYSFTFERNKGLHVRSDGHGTPLWYWGPERERSYEEADTDWGKTR